MRILITGSSGYIASAVGPALKHRGHTLVGLDRETGNSSFLDHFHHGDLLDTDLVCRALSQVEMVLHLAAAKGDWGISEEEYFRDNLKATRNLLRAAKGRGIKHWMFYSTVAAIGPSDSAADEGASLAPIDAYGESKAEAEALFNEFSSETGAHVTIVRPSVVFGPGNPPDTNIYRLIEAVYRRRFVLVGDGDTLKTTSYIENLVEATLFLMERFDPGVSTYIYVDDPVRTTGEIVHQIYSVLDRFGPMIRMPLWLARPVARISDAAAKIVEIDFPITAARIEKFCRSTYYDGSAIRDLGFKQPVDNQTAMERTITWHLNHA
jgi:nucleoside-diphosphate-sugar epimerase